MLQLSPNQEALNALAEFKSYAGGTLLVLDLMGTFVFALSGAGAAIREKLDLFGVLVVSFAAASAGGITRDLLIGATPPAAISDWRYLAVAVAAGLAMFLWYPIAERSKNLRNHVLIFDAAGLGLFAVVGTQKALGFHLHPVMAALLGMLTGIGGGVLRDVLIARIPWVLRSELYAVAALAGALVVVAGHLINLPPALTVIVGAVVCFSIRLIAVRRGWNLPVSPPRFAFPEQRKVPARNDDSDQTAEPTVEGR